MKHKRKIVQGIAALVQNANIKGFAEGTIFKGGTKHVCVPGLNCYSCPGALGSCPIGSLQAVLGSWKYKVSLYVFGLLLLFGMTMGRWICGWLCPFGLLQELIYKLKTKKIKTLKAFSWLKYIKYIILIVMVILLPALIVNPGGIGDPWFCKYICPAGTLTGALPLMAANESLRQAAGGLFVWKLSLASAVLIASLFIYRFFCKVLCPLGAFYGLLNRIALYRLHFEKSVCIRCGACRRICKMEVDPVKKPNSTECIRCGDCVKTCPTQALKMVILKRS